MDRNPGNGTVPVERDANAKLIASAPELLEVCLRVVRDSERGVLTLDTVELAQAIIRKATGE